MVEWNCIGYNLYIVHNCRDLDKRAHYSGCALIGLWLLLTGVVMLLMKE